MAHHSNKLFLWNNTNLYLGDSFETDFHRHNAVQCCIALKGQLKIKTDLIDNWQQCTTAIIGANISHSIANPDGPVCLIYLEKCSDNYRSIQDYHGLKNEMKHQVLLSTESIPENLIDSAAYLQSLDLSTQSDEDVQFIEQKMIRFRQLSLKLFRGFIEKRTLIDPRVTKLLSFLNQRPDEVIEGKQLANEINLSQSRMQHLFKQQIGVPIRRYVLWMRLRNVIKNVASGVGLTESAHSSGFSDSAHFSRTFKSMFGIAAATVMSKKSGLQTYFCD